MAFCTAVSPDGRFVAFSTTATNLAALDNNGTVLDVFRTRVEDGELVLVSGAANGMGTASAGANGSSMVIANEGTVVITSGSNDLVAGDDNGFGDVFVLSPLLFVDGFETGDPGSWGAVSGG